MLLGLGRLETTGTLYEIQTDIIIMLLYFIIIIFFYILLYYFFLRLRKSNQRLRITQRTNISGRLRHAIYYLFFKKS